MRLGTILTLFLSLVMVTTHAQERGHRDGKRGGGERPPVVIKGMVFDENTQQPLEYATISLYAQRDSSLVDGTVTDVNGQFILNTRAGKFFMLIDFLSYNQKRIDGIRVRPPDSPLDLGEILLTENSAILDEVEVVAEKSSMELKLDKRVFNVGKDLTNAGGSASDILDNVPSVEVDVEGNVSLRGSENVRILIDGRPSGLVASGADALRSMQGDMVKSVEVITNPSARYDAEGEVGIINIILKKEKKKGVNGSFGLTAGIPANYGASYSLNFRRDKINLFSNFGISYRENRGYSKEERRTAKDGDLILESDSQITRKRLSGNFQLGMDYYINPKNIITVSGLGKYTDGRNPANTTYKDYENGQLTNSSTRVNDEEEDGYNLEGSFLYQKLFDKKDHKFTFDVKYIERDETEIGDFEESFDNQSGPSLIQRSSSTEDAVNTLVQSDYVHPFGENGRFELGVKASFRTIENDYIVEEQDELGEWKLFENNQGRTFKDDFLYQENIYAAYAMYGNKIKRFGYQVGIRTEYSDIETRSLEVVNPRNYINWFPSAHLTYEVSEKDQFQLSYSRRLTRPRFWYLLPFLTFNNPRNLFGGNPDINPEYADSYEFGFLKFFEKGSLLTSIYYRHRTDVISRLTIPGNDGTASGIPVNLPEEDNYGLEINLSYEPTKWWRLNANTNIFRATLNATDYVGEYKPYIQNEIVHFNSLGIRITSRMKFLKGLNFQQSFRYRAPSNTTQGQRLAVYMLDLGLSKDILKGKGTVTLSGKDILNSRIRRSEIDLPQFYSQTERQRRNSQQVILNFIYRLNQKKSRRGGKRGGSAGGDDMDF